MTTDCSVAPRAMIVAEMPLPLVSVTPGTLRPSGNLPKVDCDASAPSAGVAATRAAAAAPQTSFVIFFTPLTLIFLSRQAETPRIDFEQGAAMFLGHPVGRRGDEHPVEVGSGKRAAGDLRRREQDMRSEERRVGKEDVGTGK